jgi:type IV pilus assembly protein PilV
MRLYQHMLTRPQHGFTLIEVLVTIVILAFGLLGLAGLQARIHQLDREAFQRAQAVVLVNDIIERIKANRTNAASYVQADEVGTGDSQPASCSAVVAGPAKDLCEWSNLLKGAAEKTGGNPIGAMTDARGCITAFTVPVEDGTVGMCQTGIQVDVAWRGIGKTVSPVVSCGSSAFTDQAQRRVISTRLGTGAESC